MLYTTRGIVLQQLRYAESSLIVKIYTEQFGLKSYIVKGVHKKKSSIRASLLQHLSLVELVCDSKEYGGLQHPKEIRLEHPYQRLQTDIIRSSIALFLNEMLIHTLRTEEADNELFGFLHESLVLLDSQEHIPAHYHLWVIIHLMHFLGIQPQQTPEKPTYLNLAEGWFQANQGLQETLDAEATQALVQLLQSTADHAAKINIPHTVRTRLLESLVKYYQWHIADFGEIHSYKILAEILA